MNKEFTNYSDDIEYLIYLTLPIEERIEQDYQKMITEKSNKYWIEQALDKMYDQFD